MNNAHDTRQPWWFAPIVWSGMAASTTAAALVIGSTSG